MVRSVNLFLGEYVKATHLVLYTVLVAIAVTVKFVLEQEDVNAENVEAKNLLEANCIIN